jgi:hypothetical protein
MFAHRIQNSLAFLEDHRHQHTRAAQRGMRLAPGASPREHLIRAATLPIPAWLPTFAASTTTLTRWAGTHRNAATRALLRCRLFRAVAASLNSSQTAPERSAFRAHEGCAP